MDMKVIIAAAAVLTILFVIRSVERRKTGWSFSFFIYIAPNFFFSIQCLTLNLFMDSSAASAMAERAEIASSTINMDIWKWNDIGHHHISQFKNIVYYSRMTLHLLKYIYSQQIQPVPQDLPCCARSE